MANGGQTRGRTAFDVVVGGGVAAGACVTTLRELDFPGSVAVVCDEPHPPYRRPGLTWFDRRLRARGVAVHAGTTVSSLLRVGDTLQARLANGATLEVDHVCVGVGVRPNVALAAAAGLAQAERGIAVDRCLRTDAPDVSAIGDVAAYDSVLHGGRMRIEHWDVARAHGSHVARRLATGETAPFAELPYFFGTMGDWAFLEYVGTGTGGAVLRGSPDGDDLATEIADRLPQTWRDVVEPPPAIAAAVAAHLAAAPARVLAEADLAALVGRAAADPRLWRPLTLADPHRRRYRLVYEDERLDLWALSWMPGQGTGFHDHGPSAVALTAVDGSVRERRMTVGGGIRAELLRPGDTRTGQAGYIHAVEHHDGEPAVTIHAYSPPLLQVGQYRAAADGTVWREPQHGRQELLDHTFDRATTLAAPDRRDVRRRSAAPPSGACRSGGRA